MAPQNSGAQDSSSTNLCWKKISLGFRVAKRFHDAQHLFVGDVPTAIHQLVLVDGTTKFSGLAAQVRMAIGELTTLEAR